MASSSSSQRSWFELITDNNGRQKYILRGRNSHSAEVYLYGGHVTSWKNKLGEELLYQSSEDIVEPSKPVREGISICLSEFGDDGPVGDYGFARDRNWIVDPDPPKPPNEFFAEKAYVDLLVKPTEEDLKIWPHSFEVRLRVSLGRSGVLMLTSRVKNVDTKPLSFYFSYINRFSVSDFSDLRMHIEEFARQGDEIPIPAEGCNNISCSITTFPTKFLSGSRIVIENVKRERAISIHHEGPLGYELFGYQKKHNLALPGSKINHMLCLSPGVSYESTTLKPGEEWTCTQELHEYLHPEPVFRLKRRFKRKT